MSALLVVLVSVLSPMLYVAIGSVVGGYAYRSLSHSCTPHPGWVKSPDIYETPHYQHGHGAVATAVGFFWPLSWAFLVARHVAFIPTADERSAALGKRIKELEAELTIGGA